MELNHTKLTPSLFLKNMTIIYFAMLIGMFLFGFVVLFLTIPLDATLPTTADTFVFAVPLLTFIGVVLGRVLYKRKLDDLLKVESLKNKLMGFQTALIIKFVLVEAPFLLGVVATLLSNNIFYIMISGTLVMYFITLKPSKTKIIKDLELNSKMRQEFKDINQVLN